MGSEAQRAMTEAARRLTTMGLSRRDAAKVLDISHQRVQQLSGRLIGALLRPSLGRIRCDA